MFDLMDQQIISLVDEACFHLDDCIRLLEGNVQKCEIVESKLRVTLKR